MSKSPSILLFEAGDGLPEALGFEFNGKNLIRVASTGDGIDIIIDSPVSHFFLHLKPVEAHELIHLISDRIMHGMNKQ